MSDDPFLAIAEAQSAVARGRREFFLKQWLRFIKSAARGH
jgi:hypothetical protein